MDPWPHPGALAPLRVCLGLSPSLSGFMPQLCPFIVFVLVSATHLMTHCFLFSFRLLTSIFSTSFVLLFPFRFHILVSISFDYGLGGALCPFLFDCLTSEAPQFPLDSW
ncbi:hypothetical protein BGW80DRAFT_524172 [Lactifluus volemus]|nr:hypothetical protein BGW80DRAFT_524172 [Lactifluus volemus]